MDVAIWSKEELLQFAAGLSSQDHWPVSMNIKEPRRCVERGPDHLVRRPKPRKFDRPRLAQCLKIYEHYEQESNARAFELAGHSPVEEPPEVNMIREFRRRAMSALRLWRVPTDAYGSGMESAVTDLYDILTALTYDLFPAPTKVKKAWISETTFALLTARQQATHARLHPLRAASSSSLGRFRTPGPWRVGGLEMDCASDLG